MIEFEKIEVSDLIKLLYESDRGTLLLTRMTKAIFLYLFVSEIEKLQNGVFTETERQFLINCLERLSITIRLCYGCELEEALRKVDISQLTFLAIDYLENTKGQPGIYWVDDNAPERAKGWTYTK